MINHEAKPQAGQQEKLILDAKMDKDLFKEKITRTILDQVTGSIREEVFRAVDEDYERLLATAKVTQHIPVLVEGQVRAEERKKRYRISMRE
jgi:hypothetical protein